MSAPITEPRDMRQVVRSAVQAASELGSHAHIDNITELACRAILNPHESEAPHCQLCGGEVQGWTCQTCEAEFEEVDGLLTLKCEAPHGSEAVAWRWKYKGTDWRFGSEKPAWPEDEDEIVQPLYAHPHEAPTAVSAPLGEDAKAPQ